MEHNLQAAGSVAANLAARDLAIVGDADLIRYVLIRELLFRFADERNLWNGVDAVG